MLVKLIRDLAGGTDRRFVDLLGRQLQATLEGSALACRAVARDLTWDQARSFMTEIEHRGDELRGQLVRELSTSLVTPIDREDLFRISRSIDDVLDNLRDFVRECGLFDVKDTTRLRPVLDAVVDAIRQLQAAVEVIAVARQEIGRRALTARKASGQIRRQYDTQLAMLYQQGLTTELLRERELLRRLDVVGLRLGEAADALSDAAVKRGDS